MNKEIKSLIQSVNKLTNRPTEYMTDGKINVGHIHVDHNSIYGGYQLQETTNDGGGVDDRVFGLSWGHRLSCKEMKSFLNGLVTGLESK